MDRHSLQKMILRRLFDWFMVSISLLFSPSRDDIPLAVVEICMSTPQKRAMLFRVTRWNTIHALLDEYISRNGVDQCDV